MRNYLISFGILIGVFFLHLWGMNGAYVKYGWFDVVTHAFVCAGVAFWFVGLSESFIPHSRYRVLIVISLTFIVGFLWEGLEVYYDITGHPLWSAEYIFDTVKDLIVDTIAATMVAVGVCRQIVSETHHHE